MAQVRLDVNTREWRIQKSRELKEFYQNHSIVKDITVSDSYGQDTYGIRRDYC